MGVNSTVDVIRLSKKLTNNQKIIVVLILAAECLFNTKDKELNNWLKQSKNLLDKYMSTNLQ